MEKKTKTEKTEKKEMKGKNVVGARGRTFQGYVTKKFDKRVVVEFERIVYFKKYERFAKSKTRIHARIPEGMVVNVGDYIEVRECRPLSKIIHAIVTKVVRAKE